MARRRLEMIDYGDDPIVDHKGRTKPLYKPRRPPPARSKRWRPGGFTKLLLGLFPGARLMVTSSIGEGLPYAIVGLLALVIGVYLAIRFNVTEESLRALRLKPKLLLVHGSALLVAIGIFELTRLGGATAERSDRSWAARAMASLLLPTALVVAGAPALIRLYPRLVEAAWFAALVLLVGALPAALGSLFDLGRVFQSTKAKAIGGLGLALLVGAAVAAFLGAEEARRVAANAAARAGFEILPKILG